VTSIGNSVKTIGGGGGEFYRGAFEGCTGLTSITLPSSVNTIEDYAFFGCTGLNDVTNMKTYPITISRSVFDKTKIDSGTLRVPSRDAVNSYKNASGWKEFKYITEI
jgi:hypothetical protein